MRLGARRCFDINTSSCRYRVVFILGISILGRTVFILKQGSGRHGTSVLLNLGNYVIINTSLNCNTTP